jgi:FG-GAP-like repeat
LAFANHEERYLTVLLGIGQGRFTVAPKSPFAVDVLPHVHGVASGDLNGDRNPDLVTDSWGTNQVNVLFGDGTGAFAVPGSLLAVGTHPYQRARVADVNGDGAADIISTNLDDDSLTVLLGDGRGSFMPATGSPFPCGNSPFNLAIGDVNGDGKPDVAVVNSPASTSDRQGRNGLTLLLGDGTGRFRMLPGSPFNTGPIPNMAAIGDVNGDGVADVAVSSPDGNVVTLLLMSRDGVASASVLTVGGGPKGLAMADLNGDGKADLVIANNRRDTVTVWWSK